MDSMELKSWLDLPSLMRSRRRERVLKLVSGRMMEVEMQGGRSSSSARRGLNSLRRLEGTETGSPSSVTRLVGADLWMMALIRSTFVFCLNNILHTELSLSALTFSCRSESSFNL